MRNLTRIAPMISLLLLAILAALALITQAGVAVLQRNHPAQGSTVAVPGARLNILDIGPRHAPGPPIVMIHGASSNLEVMRQPVGERLAGNHRVILIDPPGHGWSPRGRFYDSIPPVPAVAGAHASGWTIRLRRSRSG